MLLFEQTRDKKKRIAHKMDGFFSRQLLLIQVIIRCFLIREIQRTKHLSCWSGSNLMDRKLWCRVEAPHTRIQAIVFPFHRFACQNIDRVGLFSFISIELCTQWADESFTAIKSTSKYKFTWWLCSNEWSHQFKYRNWF